MQLGSLALLLGLCWLVTIMRFIPVLCRRSDGAPIQWAMWVVSFAALASGTTFLLRLGGLPVSFLPSAFAALAYVAGIHVSAKILLPHSCLNTRQSWLIRLSWAVLTWLLGATLCSYFISTSWLEPAVGLVFDPFILLANAWIVIPALSKVRESEKKPLVRMRLLLWITFYTLVSILMLGSIASRIISWFDIRWEYQAYMNHPARAVVVSGMGILFISAYFAPSWLMGMLAKLIAYYSDLTSCLWLGLLELWLVGLAESSDYERPDYREVFLAPMNVAYWLVIRLLDLRVFLKLHKDPLVRKLGNRLDVAAEPNLEYPQVVARLCSVSGNCILQSLFIHFRFAVAWSNRQR